MKRKVREGSAAYKSSVMPTDRMERSGTERNGVARNRMARNKRQVNGLTVIGLTGIMTAGMGLTGYENYRPSSEMKAGVQPGDGGVSWGQESPSADEPSAAWEEGSADKGSKAETIKLDIE